MYSDIDDRSPVEPRIDIVLPKYLCERCGGTGKQEAGLWTGKEYNSVEGVCDACKGSGYLGEKECE